jgi:hypothetical protein
MNSLTAWGLREAHKRFEKSGNRLLQVSDLIDWSPIRQILAYLDNQDIFGCLLS